MLWSTAGEEAHQTVPLREETQIPCFDFRQGRATGIEQVQAFCLNVKSSWYLCFFTGFILCSLQATLRSTKARQRKDSRT